MTHNGFSYRSILDSMADAIHVVDSNLVIKFMNTAFSRWNKELGLENDVLGKKLFDVFPFLPEWVKDEYQKVFKDGDVLATVEKTELEGKNFFTETRKIPVMDGKNVIQVITVVRDITDQKDTQEALRESEAKYRSIFESFFDVYYRTDKDGKVILISPSVTSHAGYQPEEIIGRPVTDFYKNPAERKGFEEQIRENGYVNDYELELLAKDNRTIPVSVSSKVYFDRKGRQAGLEGVLRDITDRKVAEDILKKSLEEKEVLLKEVHHRVKNNMQIISSLLNLQSGWVRSPIAREMFKNSQNRIRAMALVHEKLYLSRDFSRIDFAEYVNSLAAHLFHVNQQDSQVIELNIKTSKIHLDINQAIPCALILNELLTNAMKHAYPDGQKGTITVRLGLLSGRKRILAVHDTGVGYPEDKDFRNPKSLGMQLVNDLTRQIDGELSLSRIKGTEFKVVF